jgi:hypothetical protein
MLPALHVFHFETRDVSDYFKFRKHIVIVWKCPLVTRMEMCKPYRSTDFSLTFFAFWYSECFPSVPNNFDEYVIVLLKLKGIWRKIPPCLEFNPV